MPCGTGLCRRSSFDVKYSWTRDVVDSFFAFRGYTDTVLEFSQEEREWQMTLYSTNGTFASTNLMDYPFGYQGRIS